MGGGQFARIELFAARGPCSLAVERGKSLRGNTSLRGNLCLRMFVGRKRRVLFHRRHTPVRAERRRSIVLQRRLSTAADKSGISGDDRRLGARRQQSPCESDRQQPKDVRKIGARGLGTSLGTSDGCHVVSPSPAPPRPNRNPTDHKGGIQ